MSDTHAEGLQWRDLPLIIPMSLVQAVIAGLVLGALTGGLVGLIGWGAFIAGTMVAAPVISLLLFVLFVIAGLLPETVKAPLLEMPRAD